MPEELKLLAFDEEDLAVISTHLQDAAVLPADMAWLPAEKRFALVVDRFDWCGAQSGERIRRRSGLHFERVLHVQRLRFDQHAPTQAVLLSIGFEKSEDPAGIVTLHFDDGGAIRLKVECLEAAMSDLGPAWPCGSPPPARA
ncbi:DUF2948 family protein [Labrys monachus]|uniref:DUF2948 family protein n=1 Tax=Labrys monachus TaxID=217067 RepID=A0ABU0FDL7_9HYPH|nr:DUF2948 family protein [Labrys monachus]MDQ0392616.1 hypothetical protein [Labrys monachus]